MKTDWMREQLERYKTLLEMYEQEDRMSARASTPKKRELNSEINGIIPTVKKIVGSLDPALVDNITPPLAMWGISRAHTAVEQALGILRAQADWDANLGPDAPSLVAEQFHPSVWEAASPLWSTGKYRVAVQQACVDLSAYIAGKAGSSLTERELVNLVFKPEPPGPGHVRLHFPGNKGTKTWRSRQEGLHLMAQGAFAGIRNVATHTDDEWPEQVALEHLAVLSVVARWTDETEIVKLGATHHA